MTRSDMAKEVFDRCRPFGVPIFIKDNLPYEEIQDERIVIIAGQVKPTRYWHNCFIKVNWCIPDIKGEGDTIRIEEVEKEIIKLKYGIGEFEEKYYRFSKDSSDTDENSGMRCHIVKMTLLFQHQNIK